MIQQDKVIHSAFFLLLSAILVLVTASCGGTKTLPEHQGEKTSNQIAKDMVGKIDTAVDPKFVYAYVQSRFVPPEGKTLLIMEQTVEQITEYRKAFRSEPRPGGWSAYWGIPEFTGVAKAHEIQTGNTQNHQMLVSKFPNTSVQSAL